MAPGNYPPPEHCEEGKCDYPFMVCECRCVKCWMVEVYWKGRRTSERSPNANT
jgi:hypothetical protein